MKMNLVPKAVQRLIAVAALSFLAISCETPSSEQVKDDPVPTPPPVVGPVDLKTITDLSSALTAKEYVISDASGFVSFSNLVSAGQSFYDITVFLSNDVRMNGDGAILDEAFALAESTKASLVPFTPIGNKIDKKYFEGTFDGKGHTIYGLYIVAGKSGAGLFGAVQNATIKNLSVVDSYVTTSGADDNSDDRLGGIVGIAFETTTIDRCSFVGNVCDGNHVEYVGGILGRADLPDTLVTNCFFRGVISSTFQQAGGIIGRSGADIQNCYVVAEVSVPAQAGALVGTMVDGSVANSFYTSLNPDTTIEGIGALELPDLPVETTLKTIAEMKALASSLGEAFADTPDETVNAGFPVLVLPAQENTAE